MSDPAKKLCLNGCFKLKPRTEFSKNRRSPDGLMARCKACELERIQRHRHGMTKAEKDALATEQGGCAVCGRPDSGAKGWVVDHDHSCCPGEQSCGACRRGIICVWCNAALGYAFDDPRILRALADYIESDFRIDQASVERVGQAIRLGDSIEGVARR